MLTTQNNQARTLVETKGGTCDDNTKESGKNISSDNR